MLYVFQMNDGRWHVDAQTNAPREYRAAAYEIRGSETRQEAEAKMAEALKTLRAA
jgi:hypothetical protein